MAETRRLYGVLDRRLAGREFVADALSSGGFFCDPRLLGWRHPRAAEGRAEGFSQCRNAGCLPPAMAPRPR
jgi:hypothetical protein